jgi:hypothetical protein
MPIYRMFNSAPGGVSIGLLALAVFVHSAGTAVAQNPPAAADFSGVERFLALTAILEKDLEPSPEQWDALFATPGYAVLLKREFQRDFFVERFRLAFMPSRAEALREQMKKDTGFRAQFLPHYLRVKAERGRIERWLAEQRPADLCAEAMEKTRALLPAGAVVGRPAVSFLVFAPDARGYDPVVLDVLDCMDKGSRLADLVGHEFHHYYRNRLVDLSQDQAALWIINQIHGEGVADLIDKAGLIRKPEADLAPDEMEYVGLYRESPAVLRTMDGLLARMNGMTTGRGELGSELRRAVPKVGHPTGLYMATLIMEELGRDALVGAADDPFAFFRLYQEAAVKRGGDSVLFSAEALAFLERLARCR